MNIQKFLKNDILYVFVVSLMIGLVLGFCCPNSYSANVKMFFHNIYVKFHPDTQKDTKTIIIETATKNIKDIPQNSIFEEPKKENKFLLFVKRVFVKEKKKEMTIEDIVVD